MALVPVGKPSTALTTCRRVRAPRGQQGVDLALDMDRSWAVPSQRDRACRLSSRRCDRAACASSAGGWSRLGARVVETGGRQHASMVRIEPPGCGGGCCTAWRTGANRAPPRPVSGQAMHSWASDSAPSTCPAGAPEPLPVARCRGPSGARSLIELPATECRISIRRARVTTAGGPRGCAMGS